MTIGIAYDTKDMYDIEKDIYYDFAEELSILSLKKELEKLGYKVILLGNALRIIDLLKHDQINCDLVYNTVEGVASRNREGFVPTILEMSHIPYIGTDSFGLSLSLNKYLTKILARHFKIKTPNGFLITYSSFGEDTWENLKKLHFPVIIKPNYEGNSSGIQVFDDIDDAQKYIKQLLLKYHSDVLCEEFIFGREITIPVIGNIADERVWDITTVDVQKTDDFWLDLNWKTKGDYKNKLLSVPPSVRSQFEYSITTLFKLLGCCDFCRFDFRLSPENEIYFIEANPLPALFKGGSFDIVGQANGYSYGETIQLIIETACRRLSIPRI